MDTIRIPDYNLRLPDLLIYPVWEYALDEEEIVGQDERTVRPFLLSPPIDPRNSYIIVRARFLLTDGRIMTGYIKPLPHDGRQMITPALPYDLHPTIVTNERQIGFCFGAGKPNIEKLEAFYKDISGNPVKVFPIRFSADIELVDSFGEGTIDGLMYFKENVTDFFCLESEDIQSAG